MTQRRDIDAKILRDMLDRGERITVVDVRRKEIHAEGAIPGSMNFDAYDALHACDEQAMEGLELPEGEPVVTYCNRGIPGRWPRISCGGEVTKRTPWRAGWKPGRTSGAHVLSLRGSIAVTEAD